MQRYTAVIEYDGTGYCGFQKQVDSQPTIQGRIEQALANIFQHPIQITGAGRTDSGVHALGQVISFEAAWKHSPSALQNAINANLPEDIVVLQLKKVASSFHPRYSAKSRAYEYYIYNAPIRRPMRRRQSWHVPKLLDVAQMNKAAEALLGEHDFSTFGVPPAGDNCVRHVFAAQWRQQQEMVVFFIEANAFLYRMVRSIVGSLKLVGDATWQIKDFEDAFLACDRSRSGATAPPQGLFLVSVKYDNFEFLD